MRKVLCLLLISCMLLATLVACSGTTLEGDEKGAMIKMGVATLPDTFDPSAYALDADTAKVFSLVYATLTTLNEEGELEASVAEKWGYFYDDIYLEDKMYFDMVETGWSDGRALSADDFVYAWKRILSPASKSPYASLLYCIKNAKAVKAGDMTSDDLGLVAADDTRIEITFEEGYVNKNGDAVAEQFAEVVASIAFAPLREDKVESNAIWATTVNVSDVLSCGPFFLRSYNVGGNNTERYMEFERNKHYFRNDEENDILDKAVIPHKIICELNGGTNANGEAVGALEQLAADYKAGSVYYLAEFNPNTYGSASVSTRDALAGYVYYFNLNNKLFEKKEVRAALSMAIDRNEVAKIVGCGAIAATGFVPTGVFDTTSGTSFRSKGGNLYKTTADVEGAKALLKQAGVTSGSFSISYVNESESGVNKAVAEYVASVWGGLGFDVKVSAVDANNTFYVQNLLYGIDAGARNPFDVMAVDLSMSSTNALAYLAPFASGFSGNYVDIRGEEKVDTHLTHYFSEEYNALAEQAVYSSDRAKRAELFHQMESLLVADSPAFALVHYKNSYAISSKLSEVEHYYNGAPNFNRAELEGWRDINKKIEAEEEAKNAAAQQQQNSTEAE